MIKKENKPKLCQKKIPKFYKPTKIFQFNDTDEKDNEIYDFEEYLKRCNFKKRYKLYKPNKNIEVNSIKLYKEEEVYKFSLYKERDIKLNIFDYVFNKKHISTQEEDYDTDEIKMAVTLDKIEEDLQEAIDIYKKLSEEL